MAGVDLGWTLQLEAKRLRTMSGELEKAADRLVRYGAPQAERSATAATVRALIRARQLRSGYLPAELFFDPGWDILLSLLLARLEDQPMLVKDVGLTTSHAQGTVSRWITKLVELGLVFYSGDERDRRLRYVGLTDLAAHRLDAYFRLAPTPGELFN